MRLRLLALLSCIPALTNAQRVTDTLLLSDQNKFYLGGHRLNNKQLEKVLKDDATAYTIYQDAKNSTVASYVVAVIGAGLVGNYIGRLVATGNVPGTSSQQKVSPIPMFIGVGVLAISVPLVLVSNKRKRNAVRRYNDALLSGTVQPNIEVLETVERVQPIELELNEPHPAPVDTAPSARELRRERKAQLAEDHSTQHARFIQYSDKKSHRDSVHVMFDDKLIGTLAPGDHMIWVPPITTALVRIYARVVSGSKSEPVEVDTEDVDADLFRIRINKEGAVELYQVDDHLKHEVINNLGPASKVVRW